MRLPDVTVVECHLLSLRQQAEIFSRAEGLVGVHGAALANLIWMPQGARIVELGSPGYNDLYWRLAAIRDLRYDLQWLDSSADVATVASHIAALARS